MTRVRLFTRLKVTTGLTGIAFVLGTPAAYAQDQQPPTPEEIQRNAEQDLDNNPDALQTADDTGPGDETETNDATDLVTNNETIVTATRRREALSDVPLAVSAVTAQTMQNSGITDIRQLNQVSPSLLVSSASSEAGGGTARIRGIGTVGENPGLESSVAVFVDGVYRNRSGAALSDLGEVDRIEVLRGPQGTLFGRNASAGLISVITAKPKFNFAANGEANIGSWGTKRFVGGVTGPVSSTIALRLDGAYTKQHGTLKPLVGDRRLNNRNRYLLRGQALWEPSDRFNFRLVGDYTHRKEYCCGATYLKAADQVKNADGGITYLPSSIAAIERGLGGVIQDDTKKRRISYTPGVEYGSKVRDWGVSGESNLELGKSMNLTSITAYRDWKWRRGQDVDYNNLDLLKRPYDGGAGQQFKTFSQELRLQGTTLKDRLDWLLGGYFAHERLYWKDNLQYGADYQRYGDCLFANSVALGTGAPLVSTSSPGCMNQTVAKGIIANSKVPSSTRQGVALMSGNAIAGRYGLSAVSAAAGIPGFSMNGVGLNDHYRQTSRNWAIFTHNKINIIDRLALTVGVRYTNERKTLSATFEDNNRLCNALRNSSTLQGFASLACGAVPAIQDGTVQGYYSQKGQKKKEHRWTGTVNLSYKPINRVLTYASFSRGYKAGGFNLDRSALVYGSPNLRQLEFAPELVDAWETGLKLGGRQIDINVALFYQKFKDFQLNTFNGASFIVENISRCKGGKLTATGACDGKRTAGVISKGVELESFMRPTRYLGVNLSATIASTKYRRNLVGQHGQPLPAVLSQLPGRRVSNAPKYTLTAGVNWRPPIGDTGLTGLIYADSRFQSQFNTGSDLDREKLQQGFMTVNMRVGIHGPKGKWGIEFWSQNLFNRKYKQVAFDAPLQGGAVPSTPTSPSAGANSVQNGTITRSTQLYGTFLGEPRVMGVTGRFKF